ncbi:thioredoxin family protein [Chitinophaga rhizophila]|uniref:Thioredoxin family protein n=1 Tax=Chitinophaga rhizophila TaxID=2866212 RepID=A0ABS7GHR8_9BACT|nr:thioredoxin fold domain-containing protein [Chitinophaga rhizophila]MBW8687248.1 thioredoxin family protein [Chitinophaga rhizophila]
MKKIVIVLLLSLCTPLFSAAQNAKGGFRDFPDWQAVLNEAKTTNKNIFVDFYATWCGPCKEMDATVYTDPRVSGSLDSNYIAVKIQMDRTKEDNPKIQSWYQEAASLGKKYQINAFPTLLFLSRKGELLAIESGFQSALDLVRLLQAANDPQNAYYLQLQKYQDGSIALKDLLNLAITTKRYKHDSLADAMAKRYKTGYYDLLSLDSQLNRSFTDLITHFPGTIKEKDRIVSYMYANPKILDSTFRPGLSNDYISYFIRRDIVDPLIDEADQENRKPDWARITKEVAKKYGNQKATNLVFDSKLAWLYKKEDWENVVKLEIEKVEKKGIQNAVKASSLQVNNLVYDLIFKKSNNPVYLKKGLQFMEVLLEKNPADHEVIDTYANVLYKIGRKHEAIQQEKKALILAEEKKHEQNVQVYKDVLKLMQENKPTWQ